MLSDADLTLPTMLTHAIQDEYLARAEYEKTMERLGKQRPFSNIIKAEERHIALLKPLFKKYDVSVPPDRGLEPAQVPASLVEVLKAGADAEVANIAMYERFLKKSYLWMLGPYLNTFSLARAIIWLRSNAGAAAHDRGRIER